MVASPASFQLNAWVFTMSLSLQINSVTLPNEGTTLPVKDKYLADVTGTVMDKESLLDLKFCQQQAGLRPEIAAKQQSGAGFTQGFLSCE